MSCEALLQKVVDHGAVAMAEVQKAPDQSEAKSRGAAVIQVLTDSSQTLLSAVKSTPDGALASVDGATRDAFLEAAVGLFELATAEAVALLHGEQAAWGDGTFIRLLFEYLPMLIELFNKYFG